MDDDLHRFVEAQAPHLDNVAAELAAGRKRTHWMWFVFPQLRGLGRSAMARHFGIASRAEAAAYLAHPVLAIEGRSALSIFSSPDDLKLRSCLTLFRALDGLDGVFGRALAKFFDGESDPLTLRLMDAGE